MGDILSPSNRKLAILLYPLLFSILFLALFASPIKSETLTISTLIKKEKSFDGKKVVVEGEVIGDVMKRGNFAWVNIRDESGAIGIWLSKTMARKIKVTGDYNFIGDRVEVIGVFNRSCQQHGGDTDIHATSLNIIKPGRQVNHPLNKNKLYLAVVLSAITLALYLGVRKRFKILPKT